MKTITYNAQYCPKRNPARAAHVAAFARLAALRPVAIGVNEAGGYRTELKHVAGYRRIQPLGYRGKNALLIRDDVTIHAHGTHKLHGRRFVGRDVPGARKTGWTEARAILWALITDPDTGEQVIVATWHTVPGQSHSARARKLLAEEVDKAAAWIAAQEHPVDLMGDTNGRPSLHIFDPLREAGATPSFAVSRDGAPIDGHWITDSTGKAEALDGYPSDHKPVACDVTWAKHRPRKPAPKPKEAPVSKPLWLPGVIRKPLPNPDGHDPKIIPVGDVFHVAVSMADSLHDFFEHDGGIESTGYIRLDGTIEQYRPLDVECDAQGDGNSWLKNGKRYGFNSWESEGMGDGVWTDAQLATIKRIIAFKHEHYGNPLRLCPGPFSPGFGYHCLFSRWNHNNHSCPGPRRVKQFNNVIVPWMRHGAVLEEDDMQLSDKIHPSDPDSPTVGDVLWSQNQLRYRTDARLKQIIGMLDPDPLSDEIAAKVNVKAGVTADQVKQAVKDALREGVDDQ